MIRKNTPLYIFIFLLFLSFYLLTASGTMSCDGFSVFQVTKSIVENHNFQDSSPYGFLGKDGKTYSKYGIGTSILSIPFYVFGKLASYFLRIDVSRNFTTVLIQVSMALLCTLFCAMIWELGYSIKTSIIMTFILGICTLVWPYSKYYYGEPPLALLIFATFLCLYLFKKTEKAIYIFLAPLLFGFSILTKSTSILFIFGILYFLFSLRGNLKKRFANTFIFLCLSGLFILLFFAYNFLRFGNIFEAGYRLSPDLFSIPILKGIYQLLLGPSVGIFIYMPILVFFFYGFHKDFFKKFKNEMITLFIFFLSYVLFHSKYIAWGTSYGARYLLPIIPFLLIPSASIVENIIVNKNLKRKFVKYIIISFILFGFISQLPGILMNYDYYWRHIHSKYGHSFEAEAPPNIECAQVPGQAMFIYDKIKNREFMREGVRAGEKSLFDFWFIYLFILGVPVYIISGVFLLLSGILIYSLSRIIIIYRSQQYL